jgi:hypothetical protein
MEKAGYDGCLVVRRDLRVRGLEGTTLQRSVCQRVGRVAGQTKRWSQTAYGGSSTAASCNGHWRWSRSVLVRSAGAHRARRAMQEQSEAGSATRRGVRQVQNW